jgi:hypothetical protein
MFVHFITATWDDLIPWLDRRATRFRDGLWHFPELDYTHLLYEYSNLQKEYESDDLERLRRLPGAPDCAIGCTQAVQPFACPEHCLSSSSGTNPFSLLLSGGWHTVCYAESRSSSARHAPRSTSELATQRRPVQTALPRPFLRWLEFASTSSCQRKRRHAAKLVRDRCCQYCS